MKKTIFTLLLSLLLQVSFSQGTTLTKGETVEYILNKLQEVKAEFHTSSGDRTYYDNNISLSGKKIRYTYKTDFIPSISEHEKKEFIGDLSEAIFSLENVKSFELVKSYGNGVSDLKILFNGEVVKWNNSMRNYILIFFDNTDPQNFDRLKNAFLHLKDLLKAEGDPFDN